METKNPVPEVKVHKQSNPFMGKSFKVNTYNDQDKVIDTEDVKIESQEELNIILHLLILREAKENTRNL